MNYTTSLPIISKIVQEIGEKYLCTDNISSTKIKEDGSYVTNVDVLIDKALHEKLHKEFPDIPFVSEELDANSSYQGLSWCIDPIDGTHNFMNDIPYYGISVGLLLDGQPVLGVIYNPHSGDIISGAQELGLFLNNIPFQRTGTSLVITSGRSHSAKDKEKELVFINSVFKGRLIYRRFSSLALDIMSLLIGRVGAVRVIGNSKWDWSAGYILAQEAGLIITHFTDNNFIIYDPKLSEDISMLE